MIETQLGTKAVWAGRILSALVILPMAFGAVMGIHLHDSPQMAQGAAHMGIPMTLMNTVLILEAITIILYAIPLTSVIGAILLTGYMGGAILTHLRIGESVPMQAALPILAWLALWLREPRLRQILPLRR